MLSYPTFCPRSTFALPKPWFPTWCPLQYNSSFLSTLLIPASFISHLQDYISFPFNKCSKFHSCESSLCSCITDMVPCQRYNFFFWLSSGCCHLLGSFLTKNSLGMLGNMLLLLRQISHISFNTLSSHLGENNKTHGITNTSLWCQRSSGMQKTNRTRKKWVNQAQCFFPASNSWQNCQDHTVCYHKAQTQAAKKILDCIVGPQSLTTKKNIAENISFFFY